MRATTPQNPIYNDPAFLAIWQALGNRLGNRSTLSLWPEETEPFGYYGEVSPNDLEQARVPDWYGYQLPPMFRGQDYGR